MVTWLLWKPGGCFSDDDLWALPLADLWIEASLIRFVHVALKTLLGWNKVALSLHQGWIGYWVALKPWALGITNTRASTILLEGCRVLEMKAMPTKSFQSFLGKLGFACQVLASLKPILHPLYSLLAAATDSDSSIYLGPGPKSTIAAVLEQLALAPKRSVAFATYRKRGSAGSGGVGWVLDVRIDSDAARAAALKAWDADAELPIEPGVGVPS